MRLHTQLSAPGPIIFQGHIFPTFFSRFNASGCDTFVINKYRWKVEGVVISHYRCEEKRDQTGQSAQIGVEKSRLIYI